jgi:hypothetical protein
MSNMKRFLVVVIALLAITFSSEAQRIYNKTFQTWSASAGDTTFALPSVDETCTLAVQITWTSLNATDSYVKMQQKILNGNTMVDMAADSIQLTPASGTAIFEVQNFIVKYPGVYWNAGSVSSGTIRIDVVETRNR